MNFRDLRAAVKEIPTYKASVLVRGNIALDRTYCLDEVETEQFLRQRIEEVMPLELGRMKVSSKGRADGASIWEAEFMLDGKVQMDKALPRDEVKKMVSDLIQRIGFSDKSDVQVRGMDKEGKEEKANAPDDKQVTMATKKMLGSHMPHRKPVAAESIRKLKRGDHVIVSRAGMQENAEVVSVDEQDMTVEVKVEHFPAPQWLSFSKIVGINEEEDKPSRMIGWVHEVSQRFIDEEAGSIEVESGWCGILRGNPLSEVEKIANSYGEDLTQEEKNLLNKTAGVIVYEELDGLVKVQYYEDDRELEQAWEQKKHDIAMSHGTALEPIRR